MSMIKLYTIGFTKKSAEKFFSLLCEAGIKRVIDVRFSNVSQLAGFTKKDDLRYFLRRICNIDYIHLPELAPNKEIVDEFKKNKGDWSVYTTKFLSLLKERQVEQTLEKEILDEGCLLCSEESPRNCHRRLIAEYLQDKWGNIEIRHF